MEEKNKRLAKENNELKYQILQKTRLQEELLEKSVKEEYRQIVSYKDMIRSLDEGILGLEEALSRCREVREAVVRNKSLLADITNIPRVSGVEMKAYLKKGAPAGKSGAETGKKQRIEDELFDRWG